jgi:nicotinamidase-related amidase
MLTLEPNRTALLVMDYQADILAMLGERGTPILERAGSLVASARSAGVAIIYVVVGFRPGYPEISPRNRSFVAASKTGRFLVTTPGADIAPAVKPAEGEVVILKHRAGAFQGTDLDMVLRAKGRDTLVLLGFSTSGVVLSTVRHAADADYELVVVKDCCADGDDEVHRVLMEKVFVRQATVVLASDVVAALGGGATA